MSETAQAPASLQVQALAPTAQQVAAVRADIEAETLADALIDAEDASRELQELFKDLRGMKPATAALLFGTEAAYRQAIARVGVASGRQLGAVEVLRTAVAKARGAAYIEMKDSELGRVVGPNTSVRYTGD